MFDNPGRYQPKDNNEKGDRGINLLPKEMQKTAARADYLRYNTERKDKIKIDKENRQGNREPGHCFHGRF